VLVGVAGRAQTGRQMYRPLVIKSGFIFGLVYHMGVVHRLVWRREKRFDTFRETCYEMFSFVI